jgi:hypothetical protein
MIFFYKDEIVAVITAPISQPQFCPELVQRKICWGRPW